jgi:hypothetical protein
MKVLLDPQSELRREIALQVIRQLPSDLIAIDFYDSWLRATRITPAHGCRDPKKVTPASIFARQLSFETFVTLLNPTAT